MRACVHSRMHMHADGGFNAELVQLDAVGGQLGQVLAASCEDEHEQREQHGDAGGVDEEDKLLVEYCIELLRGHYTFEALAEEGVVDCWILLLGNRQHVRVVHLGLAEARDAPMRQFERADYRPEVSRVELVKAVDHVHQFELRHHGHGWRLYGLASRGGLGGFRLGRQPLAWHHGHKRAL